MKQRIHPDIDKFIQQMSLKLPERTFIRMDVTYITGAELKLTAIKDYKGKPLEDEKVYELDCPVEKVHDHLFRMRLAFLRQGYIGLANYLEKYLTLESFEKFKQRFLFVNA